MSLNLKTQIIDPSKQSFHQNHPNHPTQRQIRNLKEFASMPDEDRRDLLRHLSEKEYQNVMVVLSGIPYNVEMNIKYEGAFVGLCLFGGFSGL